MENFNKLFANVVESACKCADEITNPYEKATIYTNLAQAIARTGNVNNVAFSGNDIVEDMYEETTSNMGSEDKKPESKADLEPAPPKKKSTTKKTATKEEAPKQQAQEEPEWTDEWTEEAEEYFDNELAKIENFQNDFELSDEELDDFVSEFFKVDSGKTYMDDITPQNIRAFCAFIDAKIAEADEEDANMIKDA